MDIICGQITSLTVETETVNANFNVKLPIGIWKIDGRTEDAADE